jgi:hypothetical protein
LITENLSTLKIHKLTQEQYDREREAGRLDANALYLTPDEEIDLSGYITTTELANILNITNDICYMDAGSITEKGADANG